MLTTLHIIVNLNVFKNFQFDKTMLHKIRVETFRKQYIWICTNMFGDIFIEIFENQRLLAIVNSTLLEHKKCMKQLL